MQLKKQGLFLQLISVFFFVFVIAGFALLPFLWAVNAIWFSKEAFVVPPYEEQKQIKKCWYQLILNVYFV